MINDYPEEIRWAGASMVGAYRIRPPNAPTGANDRPIAGYRLGRMRVRPYGPGLMVTKAACRAAGR